MTNALIAATAKTSRASADLLRIVRINEEIKRVVGVSFKINIMALNAIFLAKRAGTAALGFGVLSNELRFFSQDLRTCMESLTGLIHGCVDEVSIVLKDIRFTRLLRQAAELTTTSSVEQGIEQRTIGGVDMRGHFLFQFNGSPYTSHIKPRRSPATIRRCCGYRVKCGR